MMIGLIRIARQSLKKNLKTSEPFQNLVEIRLSYIFEYFGTFVTPEFHLEPSEISVFIILFRLDIGL